MSNSGMPEADYPRSDFSLVGMSLLYQLTAWWQKSIIACLLLFIQKVQLKLIYHVFDCVFCVKSLSVDRSAMLPSSLKHSNSYFPWIGLISSQKPSWALQQFFSWNRIIFTQNPQKHKTVGFFSPWIVSFSSQNPS